jgi:chromate transporter
LGPGFCRGVTAHPSGSFTLRYGRRTGTALVSLFGVLLIIALTLTPFMSRMGQVAAAFYRTGALVFGGGHVVLPLLKHAVVDPGWIDDGTFLAGYGAAQAVPGPMFAVSAYLGERIFGGQGGALGAAVSLLAIFLPGLLIVSGALPFWHALSARDQTARILAGVNAAVVGLLAAALYNPVWLSAVRDSKDFAIVLMGFVFLVGVRWPAWIVVLWCVMASLAFI